nr:hypothetical protein [Candidatus Freyarchaeota archaeon]
MILVSSTRPYYFYSAKRHILIVVSNPTSLESRVLKIRELLNFEDRELAEAARRVLEAALERIVELGVPFILREIGVEVDFEDPLWSYAVLTLEVVVWEGLFETLRERVVNAAYSDLEPEKASRVLLDVRPYRVSETG